MPKVASGNNVILPEHSIENSLLISISLILMLLSDIKQNFYSPNDYIVPTDKKRKALRWEIRAGMA